MEKKELAKSLMLMVRALGIEEEMRQELHPERTSNGYEIYYDEESGEAVGIVYNGIVHLKRTSSQKMNWDHAVEYCKTVNINGILSELCLMDGSSRVEFENIHEELYKALKEIWAENLDQLTWCSEYSYYTAWAQRFSDGTIYNYYSKDSSNYVRPILVLKR